MRNDLVVVDIRGNVGTRLARVAPDDLDAVVLAAAGLERIGQTDRATDSLAGRMPSAPAQGALAVECRAGDLTGELADVLGRLDDRATRLAVTAERAVLAELEAGCAAPLGAYAHAGHDADRRTQLGTGTRLHLNAAVATLSGDRVWRLDDAAWVHDEAGADALGRSVARALLADGAGEAVDLHADASTRGSSVTGPHDREQLWADPPLRGRTLVVTRPDDDPLVAAIRDAGATVLAAAFTTRQTLPVTAGDLAADGYDWIAVTSAATFTSLAELGIRLPATVPLAVVGPATARAAVASGLRPALQPDGTAGGAELAALFPPPDSGSGRVLLPGAERPAPGLIDGLRRLGWQVDHVPVYRTVPIDSLPADLTSDKADGRTLVVTAGSAARAAVDLLGTAMPVVAFGAPSAVAAREAGFDVVAVAQTQDGAGLIEAVASLAAPKLDP